MAQNENNPKAQEEIFFKELKSRVVYAYYTSEIGIKQEMEYKGNTYQVEFAGYDVSKER
jgi:gluconate 2-dehydrogenase subunit 3-like protein